MSSEHEDLLEMPPILQELVATFDTTEIQVQDDWVECLAGPLYVIANVVEAAQRARIRVYLPFAEEKVVDRWVQAQPAPRSGLLQSHRLDDGIDDPEHSQWRPRLVFERPLRQRDWASDPLLEDVDRYLRAWLDDALVPPPSDRERPYAIEDDPRDIAPASAWLLKGSEASFPTQERLAEDQEAADVGIFAWDWTTAAQTRAGDLVLFYFMTPRRAVHFVARAASDATFSRDITVNADNPVNRAQWWGTFTTPIEIEPIPVSALREAVGGYLPLRGRSGLFLRPEAIRTLRITAMDPARAADLDRVVRVPTGLAELPDPAGITPEVWRSLSAGALPLEAHVSSHLVEPVLRDALAGSHLTWKREYRVGPRWADFVVLDDETPVHVIEVKKVLKEGPTGGWPESPDLHQLRWYADRLHTAATLIDSHRALLVPRDAQQPSREIDRRSCTEDDLKLLHQHLLAPGPETAR